MNLALLAPLGLAALLAVIVPALIHLRRRTEEVPVDFAAMRWLEERPRPRRKLRLEELLLLALRILLIVALAVCLARPAILGWEGDARDVLVAPGVDPEAARALAEGEADLRWIAPGFPGIETAPPARVPVSSLIRQFDAELPPGASLTVLVPDVLDGVDAEPLALTRKVEWRIVESKTVRELTGRVAVPSLSVRHSEGSERALRFLSAASQAWSEDAEFDASTGADLPPQGHVLVWLKPGPVPQEVLDWASGGGTLLAGSAAEIAMPGTTTALWRDRLGDTLVEGGPVGEGRIMRLVRPLTPSAMPELLDAGFAARLRDLVTPPAPPPARVRAAEFEPIEGAAPYPAVPRELDGWLAVAIALVFLAERILATRRGRFVS